MSLSLSSITGSPVINTNYHTDHLAAEITKDLAKLPTGFTLIGLSNEPLLRGYCGVHHNNASVAQIQVRCCVHKHSKHSLLDRLGPSGGFLARLLTTKVCGRRLWGASGRLDEQGSLGVRDENS